MSEETRSSIIRNFRDMAKGDPDAAQSYFRHHFIPGPSRPEKRNQFRKVADQIATACDGASYQVPRSLIDTMARITDVPARAVMSDVAQSLNLTVVKSAPEPANG